MYGWLNRTRCALLALICVGAYLRSVICNHTGTVTDAQGRCRGAKVSITSRIPDRYTNCRQTAGESAADPR